MGDEGNGVPGKLWIDGRTDRKTSVEEWEEVMDGDPRRKCPVRIRLVCILCFLRGIVVRFKGVCRLRFEWWQRDREGSRDRAPQSLPAVNGGWRVQVVYRLGFGGAASLSAFSTRGIIVLVIRVRIDDQKR